MHHMVFIGKHREKSHLTGKEGGGGKKTDKADHGLRKNPSSSN